MCKIEGAALKLVRGVLGPTEIEEHYFAGLSSGEWMLSIAQKNDGSDRRFRYTRGRLFDEANIGDARV